MPRYTIWNHHDPNDTFEVTADTPENAAFAALEELGWCVGEASDEDDEYDTAEVPEDWQDRRRDDNEAPYGNNDADDDGN